METTAGAEIQENPAANDSDPDLRSPAFALAAGLIFGPIGLVYVNATIGCAAAVTAALIELLVSSPFSSPFGMRKAELIVALGIRAVSALAASSLCRSHNEDIVRSREKAVRLARLQALWDYQKNFPERGAAAVTVVRTPVTEEAVSLVKLDGGMGVQVHLSPLGCRIVSVISPNRQGLPGPASPVFGGDSGGIESTLCGTILDMAAGLGRFTPEAQSLARRRWECQTSGGAVLMRCAVQEEGTEISVRFRLSGTRLRIEYEASVTSPRPVQLTHAFCFSSPSPGTSETIGCVADFEVTIPAELYALPGESVLRPTAGTPDDFRTPRKLKQTAIGEQGYSHLYSFRGEEECPCTAVIRSDSPEGRSLSLRSTDTGLWMCSGNVMKDVLALPHEIPALLLCPIQAVNIPLPILQPEESYRKTTEYEFGVTSWKPYVSESHLTDATIHELSSKRRLT